MSTETFDERVARLRQRTSVANWKGPGSKPVTGATWDEALMLETMVAIGLNINVGESFISCGEDGSISIRWNMPLGRVIDLEIGPVAE